MISLNHNIIFDYIYLVVFFLIITPLVVIINKKNILTFYVSNKVQNTNSHKASLLGGILLFIYLSFFFKLNIIFIFFLLSITIIGFLSDSKFFENSTYRLILLYLTTLIYVYTQNTLIKTTGFNKLDLILNYKIINILFTAFCITLVINGCNFIDGINNNLNFYFIQAIIVLSFTLNSNLLDLESILLLHNLTQLMVFIIFLAAMNYFSIIFNGDSGAYLMGAFISVLTINIVNNSAGIQPMLASCIFVYPSMEVLFSILRKKIVKTNHKQIGPLHPDNKHIHMILLKYIKKKFTSNVNNSHLITSLIIFIYNGIYLLLVLVNKNNFLNLNICFYAYLTLYCFFYFTLLRKVKL